MRKAFDWKRSRISMLEVKAVMRKAFDWKRSRISMLEVKAVPQSFIS
jgi:hypothetical protein